MPRSSAVGLRPGPRPPGWPPGPPSPRPCGARRSLGRTRLPRASTAVWEATSPAAWPPMPSATANRGAATRSWSWLVARTRPTSVAEPARSSVIGGSLGQLEDWSCRPGGGPLGAAPPEPATLWSLRKVPLVEPRSSTKYSPVPPEDPGVELGDERVVGQGTPQPGGPSDGQLLAQLEGLAGPLGRRQDHAGRPDSSSAGDAAPDPATSAGRTPLAPRRHLGRATRSTPPGGPAGKTGRARRGRCT